MREALGLIGANALLLVAGAAVLTALGVVRLSVRDIAQAAGLALATGIATVMMLDIIVLVLGGPGRVTVTAGLCLLVSLVGFAWAWRAQQRGDAAVAGDSAVAALPTADDDDSNALDRRAPAADGDGHVATSATGSTGRLRSGLARVFGRDGQTVVARVAIGLTALGLAVFLVRSWQAYVASPVQNFDEFAIWSKKALVFFYYDGLDPSFFANAAYNPIHLEYPILLPALEGFVYRAMGQPDTFVMHGEMLVILVAFGWSFLVLVARDGRNWLWIPVLAALLVSPFVHSQQSTGLADITSACFAGLGILLVAQWIEGAPSRALILGSLFLAAAANTKIEGLMTATVTGVVALAVLLITRAPLRLRTAAAAVGLFLLLVLPWRVWVAAHPAIDTFFNFGHALNPLYLIDHIDLAPDALANLQAQLTDARAANYAIPVGLAMTLVAIVSRVDRWLAAYYLAIAGGVVVGLVWIWVVVPGTWSPGRVISIPTIIAAVAVMHLGARVSIPALTVAASADTQDERAAEQTVPVP